MGRETERQRDRDRGSTYTCLVRFPNVSELMLSGTCSSSGAIFTKSDTLHAPDRLACSTRVNFELRHGTNVAVVAVVPPLPGGASPPSGGPHFGALPPDPPPHGRCEGLMERPWPWPWPWLCFGFASATSAVLLPPPLPTLPPPFPLPRYLGGDMGGDMGGGMEREDMRM